MEVAIDSFFLILFTIIPGKDYQGNGKTGELLKRWLVGN
jgi:hypothetical protein